MRRAVVARSEAAGALRQAIDGAREDGYPWTLIGSLVGTSGEAARQRYGRRQQA